MKRSQLRTSLAWRRYLPYILAAIPPLWLGIFLLRNAVNTPFYDQWELVPILQHVNAGHFYFHDFWQQHNEHRIFFPRLIMVAAATITHWNTGAELMIGFIIAVASFLLLLKTLRNSTASMPVPLWLPIVLSLVWFSIAQWENWLWGWQIQWFLSVFGVMAVIYALSSLKDGEYSWTSVGLVMTGGLIAEFSLGNGLLIWVPAILMMLYVRTKIIKTVAVAATGIIATIAYYTHYVNPANNPPKSFALHHPKGFVEYFVTYVGRPITHYHRPDMILGVLLTLLFVGLALFIYRKGGNRRFTASLPWFSLALYAFLSAVITDLSRLGLGLNQASTSRYTTISSLLVCSLLVLVVMNYDLLKDAFGKYYKAAPVVLILFVIAILNNASYGLKDARVQVQYLKDIQRCTHAVYPLDVCLKSTYPQEQIVQDRLAYLKKIHWAGY